MFAERGTVTITYGHCDVAALLVVWCNWSWSGLVL